MVSPAASAASAKRTTMWGRRTGAHSSKWFRGRSSDEGVASILPCGGPVLLLGDISVYRGAAGVRLPADRADRKRSFAPGGGDASQRHVVIPPAAQRRPGSRRRVQDPRRLH